MASNNSSAPWPPSPADVRQIVETLLGEEHTDPTAAAFEGAAALLASVGQWDTARSYLLQAEARHRELQNHAACSRIWRNCARICQVQERGEEARRAWETALAFANRSHDSKALVESHVGAAGEQERLGQYLQALQHYEAAQRYLSHIPPAAGAKVHLQLARLYRGLGHAQEALACVRAIHDLVPRDDPFALAATLEEASCQLLQGHPADALHRVLQVQDHPFSSLYSTALDSLLIMGEAYARIGDTRNAHIVLQRARELSRREGQPEEQLRVLLTMARTLSARSQDVVRWMVEASKLDRQHRLNANQEISLRLVDAHMASGDWSTALTVLSEVIDRAEKRGENDAAAQLQLRLVELKQATGDYEAARQAADQALKWAKGTPNLILQAEVCATVGRSEELLGNTEAAVQWYQTSLHLLEDPAISTWLERSRAVHHEVCETLLRNLVVERDVETTLEVAQRLWLESAVPALESAPGRLGPWPVLMQAERTTVLIHGLMRQMETTWDRTWRRNLSTRLDHLRDTLTSALDQLSRVDPFQHQLRTFDIQSIESIRKELPQDTAIVMFCITTTQVLQWIVTPAGEEVRVLDVLPLQLTRLCQELEKMLRTLAGSNFARLSADLGRILFGDIEEHLAFCRRILIVPHGPLVRLPFSTLMLSDSAYLVHKYEIIHTVSPMFWNRSVMLWNSRTHHIAPNEFAVLRPNEPMPQARMLEVDAVVEPGGDGWTPVDTNVTLPSLSEVARNSRFLRLLALSHRSTSSDMPGDIGAWHTAHLLWRIPSSIVSQWRVDRAAKDMLLYAVVSQLAAGFTPAASLRKAQWDMLRSVQYNHPHFWAGWSLWGGP